MLTGVRSIVLAFCVAFHVLSAPVNIISNYVNYMCVSPIKLPNPYFGRSGKFDLMHDCTSKYIEVPCRRCPQCLKSRQYDWLQRVELESLRSHLFFCTLTYNQNLPDLVTETGECIKCVDWHDYHLFKQRIYDSNLFGRPFKALAVSERGDKRHRPHFHIIFAIERSPYDNAVTYGLDLVSRCYYPLLNLWYRNIGSRRSPVKVPLCTYVERWQHGVLRKTFDFSYVQEVGKMDLYSAVSQYVTSYIVSSIDGYEGRLQKALKLNYDPELYKEYWNKVKSKLNVSPDFGYSSDCSSPIYQYLRECIEFSLISGSDVPLYFSQVDGHSEPLCRYYSRVQGLFTESDLQGFYDNADHSRYLDTIRDLNPKNRVELDNIYSHYSSIVKLLDIPKYA